MDFHPETKILIVDDVPTDIKVLASALSLDYRIFIATNGYDAINTAKKEAVDIVLLDVEMLEIDGFEVCKRLHDEKITRNIPVIFTSSRGSAEDIAQGLSLGAFYYLTKPLNIDLLKVIISAAVIRKNVQQHLCGKIHSFSCPCPLLSHIKEGRFSIRTFAEALDLSVFLSLNCPNPEKAAIGLREMLVNAIEHGNLGLTYHKKTLLNQSFQLEEERERLLALPENQSKQVMVWLSKGDREICFRIKDDGIGFDSAPYLNFSSERMLDTHGRGIAIAVNASFDHVQYHGSGNEVECVLRV
ncbi:MAG: response regulator [Nitrospirae bacterium]|nr:response regulator [Magnetococcales bacterium]HAT50084.1 response regulator receiver protein [Alphaproteobacteria bacterium]